MKSRYRAFILMLSDTAIVVFLFSFIYAICHIDEALPIQIFFKSLLLAAVVYLLVMILFGIYKSLWRYAQPKEYFMCNIASFAAGFVFFGISRLILPEIIPFYFYLLVMSTISIAFVTVRLLYRVFRDYYINQSRMLKQDKRNILKKRTIIVGCGAETRNLLDEITKDGSSDILPIIAVDDDISKIGKYFQNIKVAGVCGDIPRLCEEYEIEMIVIAMPSATNSQRSVILEYCVETGCEVKIMPHSYDFTTDTDYLSKLREITTDELLGRDPQVIADNEIYSFVSGKTVMVTGGGGSIGSELCRQIAKYNPKKLVIVDIYENNAYDIEQELKRKYSDSLNLETVIASVREYDRINRIMEEQKPVIVFHAAAHKHVPLMENSPQEAVKNNIFGTLNVARAAEANGVKKFIMISTDKAVNPTNIMGASKRICEMIIQSMSKRSKTVFAAVRFGNVLGSNGSVIPLFKKQIEEGGPVTITHPDIIRYFMTIPEAAQLVLTAGAMAAGGEIFVLDMGKPVKILDLAKKLIFLAGLVPDKDIKIEYIGLRPGEKLFEELLLDEEGIRTTDNNKIFVGNPSDISYEKLIPMLDKIKEIAYKTDIDSKAMLHEIETEMMKIVPNFRRAV
ncbi:MAG: nucleoside-diphosphate sugar epimerase/dehydratase [Oscillospiraceae bacterium]|nr:nucleoside-diphosphate sugar epimerase/dehydratase [Oscillospiraceae bacterium]